MEKSNAHSTSVETTRDVDVYTTTTSASPAHDLNYTTADEKELEAGRVHSGELVPEENSPYPEVVASVPPTDEDLPVNTFRAWFLGIIFTIVLGGLNQFFVLHNPPLSVSSFLVILASLPCGRAMALVLPTRQFTILGSKWSFNPGPFNYKEHTMIAIMAIASSDYDSGAVSSYVWTSLEKMFDIPISVGFKLMFLLTSQFLCLGLAGMFYKMVVEPAYCVWPAILPTCAVVHSMHNKKFQDKLADGWKITRMNFFWLVFAGCAIYEFIPGYLFTALTTFAWITWIVPNNVTIAQVFGATTGMDLLPLTLDWNQITAYLGSPLVMPTWALVNVVLGSIFFIWVIAPALHWSNVWSGQYLPIVSSDLFDNTGNQYNMSRVLTADYTLNEQAYHEYSPIFLSTTAALSYGLGFASITSILVHAYLHHRQTIWKGLKATFRRGQSDSELVSVDIHSKLMRRYKQVPWWWHFSLLLVIFGLTILFVEYFNTGLPWWGVILSLAINVLLLGPSAIMMAMCNVSVSTNIISALIGGFIWPGRMIAVVVFKILTFNTTGTALVILRDMKLGTYMKIPPRSIFMAQFFGMIASWLAQVGVNVWAMGNIEGVCTLKAKDGFICPISISYETSITFWGLIGPAKLFSSGAMYSSMMYFFLIGAVLPVIAFYLAKRWPSSFLKYVHVPAIMSSIAAIPPATAGNYIPWGVLGLIFNVLLKNRWRVWWTKYNYLASAGLDAGLALATFLIFFCLSYPGVELNWWGNTVASAGADALGLPLKTPPEGTTFGPSTWR